MLINDIRYLESKSNFNLYAKINDTQRPIKCSCIKARWERGGVAVVLIIRRAIRLLISKMRYTIELIYCVVLIFG